MRPRKRSAEIFLTKLTFNRNGIRIMSERKPKPKQFLAEE